MFKQKADTLHRVKEPSVVSFFDAYTDKLDLETKKTLMENEVDK